MKQHITKKQLNELGDKAKEKLGEWWHPRNADICECGMINKKSSSNWNKKHFKLSKSVVHKHLPLLSIGQMIEFLGGEWDEKINIGFREEPVYPNNEKLCDVLWKAVREKLYDTI